MMVSLARTKEQPGVGPWRLAVGRRDNRPSPEVDGVRCCIHACSGDVSGVGKLFEGILSQ